MHITTTARIDELIIAKHRLAQLLQDSIITNHHPALAENTLKVLFRLEKQIMSSKTPRRNKFHAKNKHKQTRG